ncbi:MAG: putative glycoside hydrolase [Solirubrobacteraceae bacterium]
MALSGAMVAPTVAVAAGATTVANFNISNDADSTTVTQAKQDQIVQLQYSPTVKTLVDQIHAEDPGVKVLMYSDTGYPGDSAGWTSCTTSSEDAAGGPSWRLFDDSTELGYMNAGSPGFESACASHAITLAKSQNFDGIFWDNVAPEPYDLVSSKCVNASGAASCSLYDGSSTTAWQAHEYSLVKALGAATSQAGLMTFINDGSGTTSQWKKWGATPGITGQMEESFVGSYLGTSVPYSQWQEEVANETWSEANGKYELAMHYDLNQNQESLDTFGLSSMLLAADGHTSYDSTVADLNAPTFDWWPEYTQAQNLGAPQGAYTTVTSSGATVYERRFANGIVVVNPTTSASGSASLGATYTGTGNEPTNVTSVTLPSQSGLVLTGSGSSTSPSGSGSGSSKATPVSLPKGSHQNVSCKSKVQRHTLTLTCTTKLGNKASTSLRLRAYHSGHQIADHATKIRHHRATFDVRLGKRRSGTYRLVVAIDAGGRHSRLTRSIRLH